MVKRAEPKLPGGRRYEDYVELQYAAQNPLRFPRLPKGVPDDGREAIFRFFIRMESRDTFIFNGVEYTHVGAWHHKIPRVRQLLATLAATARGMGHSRTRARGFVKAWCVLQVLSGGKFEWIVRHKRYDECHFSEIIRSFIEFVEETTAHG